MDGNEGFGGGRSVWFCSRRAVRLTILLAHAALRAEKENSGKELLTGGTVTL
jgi:hypothetical protein